MLDGIGRQGKMGVALLAVALHRLPMRRRSIGYDEPFTHPGTSLCGSYKTAWRLQVRCLHRCGRKTDATLTLCSIARITGI